LVGPLGFSIDQKDLRRAGLDYWDKVFQCFYPTLDEYIEAHPYARRYLFSARVCRPFWEVQFQPGDHLVFGSETKGLPKHWIEENQKHTVTLPMLPDRRSLNLSTTVGIAAYEAIRQISYTPT
jgi:tRNA (cytidine/uridine-2'-O-)-methyltransferase